MSTTPVPAQASKRPVPTGPPRHSGPPRSAAAAASGITLDPIKVIRQNIWKLVIGLCVGVVISVIFYFVALKFFPSYTAHAIFECQPLISNIVDPKEISAGELDELEKFMKTQAYEMTRDNILQAAVNSPAVKNQTEWAKKYWKNGQYDRVEAFLDLKEDIHCSAIPETFYLQLSMKGRVPEDLPIIINTVADEYLLQLSNRKRQEDIGQRDQLEAELGRLKQRRKQLEESMSTFMAEHNISVLEELASKEAQELMAITNQLTQAQQFLDQSRQSREMYESIFSQEGIINYPDTIKAEAEEHPRIAALQNQLVQMRAFLRSSEEQFGPNHREVKNLQRQIRAMEEQIETEKREIMHTRLSAMLDQAKQLEQRYTELIADLTKKQADANTRMRDLTANIQRYHQMEDEQTSVNDQIDELETTLRNIRLTDASTASDRVQKRGEAQKPDKISFPNIVTVIPGVTFLVFMLVVGYVFLMELIDQRVKSPADILGAAKGKVLGIVPDLLEDPAKPDKFDMVIKSNPQSVTAESIRQIRTPLLKRIAGKGSKGAAVVVIGTSPGAGTTSVLGNLALSAAALEKKVLVIDANYRRPRMHQLFDKAEAPGLSDLLAGTIDMDAALQETGVDNLSLITAGSEDKRVVEQLGTKRLDNLLDRARELFDLVLIDSAPAIVAGDSELLANHADASILVTRAMRDKRGLVSRLAGQLGQAKADFLGVIVNAVQSSAGGYYRKNIQAMSSYQNGVNGKKGKKKAA